MSIRIDGTILSARGTNLSNLISGYINKKQQTLQSLYEQQAAIEDMYNTVASGLYTAQSSSYQLNTYYNNQILSKNATVSNLQAQIKLANGKISALNSMHNSFSTTVTSLDDFLNSVRDSASASSIVDYTNSNLSAVDVSLTNTSSLNTQRIEYNVKQVATATVAKSYTLNGFNVNENTLVKDLYAGIYDSSVLTGTRSDLDESMTMKQLGVSEGFWDVGTTTLYISENDTLGDIARQLKDDGFNAGIRNGQFFIDSRNVKDLNIHNQQSNLGEVLGLTVSKGDFTINGKSVVIDDTTSVKNLLDTINNDYDYGVGAYFNNNQLMLVANQTGNVLIEINKGTSNFTNVAGFTVGGKMISDKLTLGSDGSMHSVAGSNNVSSLSENLTSGEFVLSKTFNGVTQKAVIAVTQGSTLQETLQNVIAEINASGLDVTALIENDQFVIKNNELGSGYEITVESGESDFVEKLGFTNPVLSSGVPSFDSNTNYFTTLTGVTDIASYTDNVVTAGSFKINGTTINLAAGSLEDAITTINSYTNTTGVVADHVGNHMILRNEYTGDSNLVVDGGTSNFGEIAGFTTQSVNTVSATYGQVGSKSTLTGSETVSSSLIVGDSTLVINGTTVEVTGGRLNDVVADLNTTYSSLLNLTFSISPENKLVISEQRNGELPISVTSVSGNFAELTGIAGYQTRIGQEEKYGSSRTTYTTTKAVTNGAQIMDSVVEINGQSIDLSGTVSEAILTINSRTASTGVEAYINSENQFTLRNVSAGPNEISFNVLSGDFGRVVGAGSYATVDGTYGHTDRSMAMVVGARTGLTEFSQVLAGSKIQFGSTIIDLGASVGAALLAINNNKNTTGVEALLNEQGQFVLKSLNEDMESISFSVIGTGDFGRVTGLGTYAVGAAESNGSVVNATYSKITGINDVLASTEITATSITLTFKNDVEPQVSRTFELADGTLESAVNAINDANWYVKAEIVDNKLQLVSRSAGRFQIGLSVNTNADGTTGDFGRVVGMASSSASAGSSTSLNKIPAKYTGATSGLQATDELIGTNKITLGMIHSATGDSASSAQEITFTDKDGDGKVTLQDAVESINDYKNVTKVEASIVNGQFVLTQTDANTGSEGDKISFTLSGDGDFARVAGCGTYNVSTQTNTGTLTGQSFTTLTGSRDIENSNEVLSGSFILSITKGESQNSPAVDLTTTINISNGTIANAISDINTQLAAAGIEVTASIQDGKLQFKANNEGDYNISVDMNNSDFGRVVGIGSHMTYDGTSSVIEKTAAKIVGGRTGLTNDSQIIGTQQITLQGLVTRPSTGVNAEGGTNDAVSSVRTIALSGTIGDAIDAINAQTASTQIRAYLDGDGRFVLEQTNQNTPSEFDTISFSLSGTGDFGAATGLGSYITYGTDDTGVTTGQLYSSISGLTGNLKGTEQITAGTITIEFTDDVSKWSSPTTNTLTVNISGTVENAAQQITAQAAAQGLSLTAYIDSTTGRFTIKSTSYGQDSISVSVQNSDLARITGIANYSMDYATVTGASSTYNPHPVLIGGVEITEDTLVMNGTLVVDGHTINTVNKTMAQIAQEVDNLGVAGVTADISSGYFSIRMLENSVDNPVTVQATGDFARLTGLGSYYVGAATFVDGTCDVADGTPSYITRSITGISSSAKFVGGSITISHDDGHGNEVSFVVDATNRTAAEVVAKINELGQSGASVNSAGGYSLNYVYATFENGQISVKTNENSHTITATGDFARVTGLSEYRASAAQNTAATTTVTNGTKQYLRRSNTVLTSETTFSDGVCSITFNNGVNGPQTISVDTAGKSVGIVVSELQEQANSYLLADTDSNYSVDGYLTTTPTISFDERSGKISIVTNGFDHTVSATGDFATLTGFDGNCYYSETYMNDIVVYNNDGLLIGSTDINASNVTNGKALVGQAGTINFYNGTQKIGTVNVSATDTLDQVISKINAMSVNNPPPSDSFNVNYNDSVSASIVDGHIQLRYGAGMDNFSVSGSSAFVSFYGLGSSDTVMSNRSELYEIDNDDQYIYTNGSITGSVDVKTMLTTGSLSLGGTNIGPFCGQRQGLLTFVADNGEGPVAVGQVEINETDSLDDIMYKINNMITEDIHLPNGVDIDRLNGFTASFTADGHIQITYGGHQGSVRLQDTSGFARYYGLLDTADSQVSNSSYTEMERPYPDVVGQSVVTGSSTGYTANSVVGGLQSGTLSVSLNGKNITVAYTNNESVSLIMDRIVDAANQTDGSGLFDYNGDLDMNILPIGNDRLSYSINPNGQIVLTAGVESETEDSLVITDLSGNFARITGIATTPVGYTGYVGTPSAPATPGVSAFGTNYYVTTYSETGSLGSFSYTGSSVNGLTGNTVLTGITDGGFYISTTDGNKWIEVNAGDTVNTVLSRINALNDDIHDTLGESEYHNYINATFDEINNRIKITATNNVISEFAVSGDTSGFVEKVGLGSSNNTTDANYVSIQASNGHSKLISSVDNLSTTHKLSNIQGGLNVATETVTLTDGAGSVNITVADDEELSSIIQKITDTGKFDAGITDGKLWIKSLADSSREISVSESNFARILGLVGGNETLSNGILSVGSYGTMTYEAASVAGLLGSSNIKINSSLSGTGDGAFRVTLSDKTSSNNIDVASLSFDVAVSENMTVNDILDAIKTASVNAGVTGLDASFDNSTHQIKITVSGNQAEQITFVGINDKGTELIKCLGLAVSSSPIVNTGTNVNESAGYTRFTGSVSGLHESHVFGNLPASETFTINGSQSVTITADQSLNQIIASIGTQTGGLYTAGLDSEGRFYIQSTVDSSNAIVVSSTDFTERVGLVASSSNYGTSFTQGSQGQFEFYGAGGVGNTGIAGMTGSTVFTGMSNGSFNFTLGVTGIYTPSGYLRYHDSTTFTVNVSSGDSVDAILVKMKNAISAGVGYSVSDINFSVEVDDVTGKGRVHLLMNGKDASEITFSNDTSGFVGMAGLSNTGATTPADYTSVNRSYGKATATGSMTGLSVNHVFGNMKTGTMVITAGAVTKTIDVNETDSIQDIADKIADGGLFSAGLNENGQFVITTVAENSSDIVVSGTSDFYNLVGIKEKEWSYTGTLENGSYGNSRITGSVTDLTENQKFNNMTSGSFTISAAGLNTLTVNVTAGSTKISDVINYINNAPSSDYTASLNSDGQFVLSTRTANGATVVVNDGTSNYAQLLGLTSGTITSSAISVSGQSDKYSSIKGSTTGLDLNTTFSAGDFSISVEAPDGTVVSETFVLDGTESLDTIKGLIFASSLNISASLDSVTGQLILTSKTEGLYKISLQDGTSNFAESTGLSRNHSQVQAAQRGTLATLTSSKTKQSAELLGYTEGSFFVSLTDKSGNITDTQKIVINNGDTIDDIVQSINNSGLGVKAEIDANTNKMVITRKTSTSEGGVVVTKGTSDFTNKIGFTLGGEQSPAAIVVDGTNASNTVLTGDILNGANESTLLGALGIKDGTIIINNKAVNISQLDSIEQFVQKVNSSFAPTDENAVTAQFVDGRVVLSSNSQSDNARILVETGTSNVSNVLGFTNGAALNTSVESVGLNSKITINGRDYESDSNIVALDARGNVVDVDSSDEAVRITIKELGNGVIDIGSASVGDTYLKLLEFANNFNATMMLAQNAALAQDTGFQSLIASLKSAITDDVGSITKVERALSNIGITLYSTLTSTGSTRLALLVNKDKFESAMMTDMDNVVNLLIGRDSEPLEYDEAGSFVRLKASIDETLKPISGYFKSNSRILDSQKRAMEKELTLTNGELAQLRAELAIAVNDNESAAQKEELEKFLEDISEQYKTISALIEKVNRQYTQSLSVLAVNKNNNSFG